MESPLRFAFVFPMASGHINPSLPIARALGRLGHEAGSPTLRIIIWIVPRVRKKVAILI